MFVFPTIVSLSYPNPFLFTCISPIPPVLPFSFRSRAMRTRRWGIDGPRGAPPPPQPPAAKLFIIQERWPSGQRAAQPDAPFDND